ncbi:acyltransferase [Fusobacterium polymorphum]|jgi:putative acetyltransferase|uniref:acyltransferase n=1 Tax=Fusobacterium nucleatum subsp. polymorphum TaxID=76857 RepID=UPI00300AEC85
MNIRNLLNLDKFLFIKLYFNKKVKGRIIPYKGTRIELGENSKLNVGKKMFINSEKLKNSNKETYILIKKNAEIKIEEIFSVYYDGNIFISEGAKLEIKSGFMNSGSQIICKKSIKIGSNVAISRNVRIWDTDAHEIIDSEGKISEVSKEVKIGNNVLIGNGTIILKGVNIGNDVVIGAGSVVTKDIPSNSLAVGNPAKVVKKIEGWK